MTRYSRRTAFGDAIGYGALFSGVGAAVGSVLIDIASFIARYTSGAETTQFGHTIAPTGLLIAIGGVAILYANRKRKSGERFDTKAHELDGRIGIVEEQVDKTEELGKEVAALS